jgi:curved DNA-binding protein CbpA
MEDVPTLADGFDPYAVLQVSPTADTEVILAAYRTLARRYHPDHSTDPNAGARMVELNAAWEVLGDPTRRAAHDRTAGTAKPAPTASADTVEKATAQAGPSGSAGVGTSAAWRVGPNGEGAAGPPPGRPAGTVLAFGRHIGWSLGEIARVDPGYLVWLGTTRAGARYRDEIEGILHPGGRPQDAKAPSRRPASKRRFGFPGR